VNEDALFRVLRALAMVGVFVETASRTFALTPADEALFTRAGFGLTRIVPTQSPVSVIEAALV